VSIGQIRQRFNSRAKHYDNFWTTFIGERELRQVRRLVPKTAEVLDYGCGTGRTTLDLLRRGCKVTAFDISNEMLAIARKKIIQDNFYADFASEPESLISRTWPVITCIGVMDYYADPLPLFKQLRRLLAPQGILVVTFPNAFTPQAWLYALGSRFTCPAIPRTIGFIRRCAQKANFIIDKVLYAFPAVPILGYTQVISMRPNSENNHDL
jgi:2-polyprenyl-3-methyl-5-hydroxy-6-metoxy-1,4-benzoquinol methylase